MLLSKAVNHGLITSEKKINHFHGGICLIRTLLMKFMLRHCPFVLKYKRSLKHMKERPITELLSKRVFLKLWAMVYFRELPLRLNDVDDDLLELFFKFANTFTEESILNGYIRDEREKEKEIQEEELKDLGYSDEDILNM